MSFGDKFVLGLSTMAIGMLVVFSGLVILIFCIWVMGKVNARKKAARAPKTVQEVPAPVPQIEETVRNEQDVTDDSLIAAITAAVACVWDKEDTGFVVRRIRRYPAQPSWQSAARDEQMYSRM
ncbi:MAG: hypothetical protein CW338_05270 [Clostridiales bacterium]|nr:hypothetical protein [Clostridiales bacterium]